MGERKRIDFFFDIPHKIPKELLDVLEESRWSWHSLVQLKNKSPDALEGRKANSKGHAIPKRPSKPLCLGHKLPERYLSFDLCGLFDYELSPGSGWLERRAMIQPKKVLSTSLELMWLLLILLHSPPTKCRRKRKQPQSLHSSNSRTSSWTCRRAAIPAALRPASSGMSCAVRLPSEV